MTEILDDMGYEEMMHEAENLFAGRGDYLQKVIYRKLQYRQQEAEGFDSRTQSSGQAMAMPSDPDMTNGTAAQAAESVGGSRQNGSDAELPGAPASARSSKNGQASLSL